MMKRVVLLAAISVASASASSAQTPQKVLAELFTNTNCGNCRVPEEAFEGFVNANPQYGVVRIVYHNEITNNDDVFYVPARSDVNARESMYSLNANPLAIIDGFPVGNNESIWENTVKQAAGQALPVTLTITTTPSLDNQYQIHVTASGSITKQARLFVALTESNIIYDNTLAYGNPTSGRWDDIFRAMLPSSTGSDPFQLSGTRSFDMTADFTDQDWNPSNVSVVAFVQDVTSSAPSSFQVEGFTKQPLLTAAVPMDRGSANSLVATARGLQLQTAGAQHVSITLADVIGRTTKTIELTNLNAGSYAIEDLALEPGLYLATATADGLRIGACKLIR